MVPTNNNQFDRMLCMNQAALKTPTLTLPQTAGVLPDVVVDQLIEQGYIHASHPIEDVQRQPASLDLRLGAKAYRVRAGFLPGKNSNVQSKIENYLMHEIDLSHPEGAVLECGAIYIIPLMEQLNLPAAISGTISPKSSTGRLDIFCRLLADGATQFDTIPAGYKGPLYLEVAPQTFGIVARQGDRLNQLRLRNGLNLSSDADLGTLHAAEPLVYLPDETADQAQISQGLWLSVDLHGLDSSGIIAYKARRFAPIVDLRKLNHYQMNQFWEPMVREGQDALILNPGDFYIMASRERLRVPVDYSAEMVAFDHTAGEFRVHYAGFFDPGWGCKEGGAAGGATAVLEIRSHDVPFVLEHGQRICRMVYEPLATASRQIYGAPMGSNYTAQKLKLAKQFNMG
jgi:dCTP deaminase